MARRIKPTELRMVAALLESEADDTGLLAEQIIEALDAKRAKDDTNFVLVTQWEHCVLAYGPYGTAGQAGKAMKLLANPGPGPMAARVVQIRGVPA